MTYVDGFVLSIKTENRAKYKKLAKEAAETWKKFGALDYKECRLDDERPQWVTFTFPKMAKSRDTEETWFSFIVFESKAERNRINKAVMKYFEQKYGKHEDFKKMPFDMKRMAYGGFKTEVEIK
jgi:uncharacterized protein YbaA (DUF1428 family)